MMFLYLWPWLSNYNKVIIFDIMLQILFLGSLFSSLLTIYILVLKRDAIKSYADYLLTVFVTFLSWNVVIYLLLHYGWILDVPYLFKTAAPLAFILPPLSYLYTRAVLFNEKKLKLLDLFHYIPFVLVFINYLPFYLIPVPEKRIIIKAILSNLDLSYTYQAGIAPEIVTNVLRILQLLVYTGLQWGLIIKYKKHNKVFQIEKQIQEILSWLKIFTWSCTANVFAFFIIIVIYLSDISLFNHSGFVNIIPLICYSGSFFVISSYLLVHPVVMNGLPFIKYKDMETNILTAEISKIPFIEEDFSNQISQIDTYFEEGKPYLNQNLTLSQVAVALNLPVRDLSYILNNYYNYRFTDFVNSYRLKYIINKFNESYLDNFTIESVALESGFISRSGFYKSFKKLYKMTPSEYFQQARTN